MKETVNVIINNLSDRVGEVIEVAGPILERLGEISQTVVQETSRTGFVYTMIGLAIVVLGAMCLFLWFMLLKTSLSEEDEEKKEFTRDCLLFYMVGAVFSLIFGLSMVLRNLSNWTAPTRDVIREILDKI